MSSIFSDGTVPGRDPNDAPWRVLRTAHDWTGASQQDVLLDPFRSVIELAPRGVAGDIVAEAIAADGTTYKIDGNRILVRGSCDATWRTLPGVGGFGWETGRVRNPRGLALDGRGFLVIADTGNHRVQIARADTGEPVAVLGCIDSWGRGVAPKPSLGEHALATPVAVAASPRGVVIADAATGYVHVYGDRFQYLRRWRPVPPGAPATLVPSPIAVAISGDHIWVLDAHWGVAVEYDLCGHPASGATPPPLVATWTTHARYAAWGEIQLGPIDGQREDLAWHRVFVDASSPRGTRIEVQTFASNDPTPPACIAWAPERPIAIPIEQVEERDGETSRLVASDHGRWNRKRGEPYRRARAPIALLRGAGPHNSAGFTLPWPAAARLRHADRIALTTTTSMVAMPIAAIAGRAIRALVNGAPGAFLAYTAGSTVVLDERAGQPPLGGPRVIYVLEPSELLDTSVALDDGTLYDLAASHGIAAIVRPGDILRVSNGSNSVRIVVDHVERADATIVLAGAVPGDFSTSALSLVEAQGRFVLEDLSAWAEGIPPGEAALVVNDAGERVPIAMRWADPSLGTVWPEPGPVIDWSTWNRLELPEPVATDRGRYLWLRIRLVGALERAGDETALATPTIRRVRLLAPRLSYLSYLPRVFARRDQDDPSGALFLERFLALPEQRLTRVEELFESVARQLNPAAADPEWLLFLATWFGLVFDPSWPVERRRLLVVHAHDLFARRGTRAGLERYLEIYTGFAPTIVEGFQWRHTASSVLGRRVLGHAKTIDDGSYAHRFSIWVHGATTTCDSSLVERAARAIIESAKPAHTEYELHVVEPMARVGLQSMVGVDLVIGGGPSPAQPLGSTQRPYPILGRDRLRPARDPRIAAPAVLEPIVSDELLLT